MNSGIRPNLMTLTELCSPGSGQQAHLDTQDDGVSAPGGSLVIGCALGLPYPTFDPYWLVVGGDVNKQQTTNKQKPGCVSDIDRVGYTVQSYPLHVLLLPRWYYPVLTICVCVCVIYRGNWVVFPESSGPDQRHGLALLARPDLRRLPFKPSHWFPIVVLGFYR
jgi:hypothetical protein